MKPTAQILCRICGDKEELERCYDILSFTIMNMDRVQNHQNLQNELRSMTQPMPYGPNPYLHAQAMPPMYQNSSFLNAQNSQPAPMMQQPLMYLHPLPKLLWDSASHESLDVTTMFGDIDDTMLLVDPVLKMFKGLKAAYRITSPMLNDFILLDDDNIFDEDLYVWGNCVPEEQLKSFSVKLASAVAMDVQGTYTFPGILMKYSDLTDGLKITNIPEGIGIVRYRRVTSQQRAEEEKRRTPFRHNPLDPQEVDR